MPYKINPILETVICKPLKWFSETKISKHAGKQVYDNNRKYIDGLGVSSIIAKDGLGCYLYVTQSLNNKEIPDDKRKFVASLDLTNGGLMILMQILMFFTFSHKVCQTKMFDKFFGKLFDRPIQKVYRAMTRNNPAYKNIDDLEFCQEFTKIRSNVKDAFGGLTSLAAATILGKRMIVPFIATPLAGKVEKRMNADSNKAPENNNVEEANEPSKQEDEHKIDIISTDEGDTNLIERYKHNIK